MFFGDSLTNIVSGLGTDKDKLSFSRFTPTLLGKFELDNMYASDWIAGTIIDAPCDDITREWRSWDAGPRHTALLQAEEARLGVRQKVNAAMKLARLHGGAGIYIGTGDEDPSKALKVDTIKRGGVQFLHVLSRYELWVQELDRDPLSPHFGGPKAYALNSGTRSAEVHPSRVVRFLGQAKLELSQSVDGWGLSTLQRVYDAVRNVAVTAQNAASLTHEAKVDVISVPNLTANATNPGYQAQLLARFGLANMAKSTQNALLLDEKEKWDQKTAAFAGLVDILGKFLEMAAGAANMPVTRLLGVAPKGLNSTGSNETRGYYDTLAGRQIVEVGPALHPLDEALIRSAIGNRPASVSYAWNPLWQMTEAEQAAIALQKAQTTQIYAVTGIMPKSALRGGVQNMLRQDGGYPGLAGLLDAAADAGEASEPLIDKPAMTGNEINTPSAGAKVAKT